LGKRWHGCTLFLITPNLNEIVVVHLESESKNVFSWSWTHGLGPGFIHPKWKGYSSLQTLFLRVSKLVPTSTLSLEDPLDVHNIKHLACLLTAHYSCQILSKNNLNWDLFLTQTLI